MWYRTQKVPATNRLVTDGGGWRRSTGISAYDKDASTLFAAMSSQPTAARKTLINDLIVGLKTDGVWNKLDVLWIPAAHDSQAATLNLKAPASFVLTPVNSPTFTADRGYATDNVTNYVETNWNPSVNGVNYTLNSAMLGVWSYVNQSSTNAVFGGRAGGQSIVNPIGSGNTALRLNSSGASSAAVATGLGIIAGSRLSGTQQEIYKDGSVINSSAISVTGLTSETFGIGRTTAGNFANARCSAAFAGAGLTDTEHASLYSRLLTYMTAVGAI